MSSRDDLLRRIESLPSDSEDAFFALCDHLRTIDFSRTPGDFDQFAADVLSAFIARYGIDAPTFGRGVSSTDYISTVLTIGGRKYDLAAIAGALNEYDKKREGGEFGFAALSSDEKVAISNKLGDIRDVIVASRLSDSKKKSLLDRLAKLETEVQMDKTPTERFFSFLGDLAMTAGEMSTNARPAIEDFKDILRIVMRSRAKSEGATLPGSGEWPQLPSPSDFGDN